MADDCRVPPDRHKWDKLLKDLNLTFRQNKGSGCGGRGGGGGGNRGGGGDGRAGQQRGWSQQQQPFQGSPGMYPIQQQQFLPSPSMLLPQQMTQGGGSQCPPPTMGIPSGSATATATTSTVTGGTAARSLWPTWHICRGPQQQPVQRDVH